jgi:hypothetical protein
MLLGLRNRRTAPGAQRDDQHAGEGDEHPGKIAAAHQQTDQQQSSCGAGHRPKPPQGDQQPECKAPAHIEQRRDMPHAIYQFADNVVDRPVQAGGHQDDEIAQGNPFTSYAVSLTSGREW